MFTFNILTLVSFEIEVKIGSGFPFKSDANILVAVKSKKK